MYVAAHEGLAGKSAAKVLQIMRKKGGVIGKKCAIFGISPFFTRF